MGKLLQFIRFFSICQTFFGFSKKVDTEEQTTGMGQQKRCL